MSLSRSARALALAVLALSLAPLAAHAQSADAQRYLIAASRLYENLEYERALDQLKKARGVSGGVDDDVNIALYEGIILSDMGKKEEAVAAFKEGLYLRPEANLPVKVAPKIQQVFTATKNDVLKEMQPILAKKKAEEEKRLAEEKKRLADEQARKAAADAEAKRLADEEAKRKADEEKARLAQQTTDRPEDRNLTPPPKDPNDPMRVERRASSGVPIAPIVVGGVAVVAGGVGAAFGIMSSSEVTAARNATFQSDTITHLNQANTDALIANIAFGVAGAAAITAVITYFVGRSAPPPPMESP
jgi:tetratricopeptide (TPR) repeat protein